MNTTGNKIRKIRELKNVKQEYMAEQLGISVAAYSKLEREETSLSDERLEQISKIFDLPVEDILAFDEKQVFNIMHNQTGIHNNNVGTHIYQFPEDMKKLYEDKIKLLEDKIEYLTKETERLKK
jgi:transcriptional regulator with XRE-family HTH domain